MNTRRYIAYFRVSTDWQGKNDRPQLAAALAACRMHKAVLIIAKLDRLQLLFGQVSARKTRKRVHSSMTMGLLFVG